MSDTYSLLRRGYSGTRDQWTKGRGQNSVNKDGKEAPLTGAREKSGWELRMG